MPRFILSYDLHCSDEARAEFNAELGRRGWFDREWGSDGYLYKLPASTWTSVDKTQATATEDLNRAITKALLTDRSARLDQSIISVYSKVEFRPSTTQAAKVAANAASIGSQQPR